jgi:exodeoxyribonuclease III
MGSLGTEQRGCERERAVLRRAEVKVATWNVNSIRARLDHACDWLERIQPDVLCMQETKVTDDDFPTDEFMRLGYGVAMTGQLSYNGVAILSRLPMKEITLGLAGEKADADRRAIAATVAGVRIFSVYVPNGKTTTSPSFPEKLAWLERLRVTLDETANPNADVLVCGDFNIATDERDVYAPELFRGKVHFHPDEHRALARIRDFGLKDAFREHHSEAGQYSWWDYRGGGFRKNEGLRIDYVFLSESLAKRCRSVVMDVEPRRLDKPSDHIPVMVDLGQGP